MRCNEERLTALVCGHLSRADRESAEAHLRACAACETTHAALQRAWAALDGLEPRTAPRSERARRGVRRLMTVARSPARDSGRRPRWALSLAAALVLGFFGGRLVPGPANRVSGQLEDRVAVLEQEAIVARLDSRDAATRLAAVDAASVGNAPGKAVVEALLRTIATDPNVNVRLAAVEALGAVLQEPDVAVRAAKLAGADPSALVQLSLTERLAGLEEGELRTAAARALSSGRLQPDARRRFEELFGRTM